jgi:diguanylate cyclase (GGDEF)-like protein
MQPRQVVLVVDDERLNIDVLVDSLRADYKIKVAKNGEQALKAAHTEPIPDLILLDIMMPELDGYEVCRRLKEDDLTRKIPVIFVSAKGLVEDVTKGFEVGAVDYITKPFHIAVVQARVRTHLRLKHKTDLLEKLAALDGLTEIPNRRAFDITLQKEWKRAARECRPISMLMIDVDLFKQYNDHYGHAAGDECLRQVAHTLAQQLHRGGDFIARYGGEEFAVILADTDPAGACDVAEHLRRAISSLELPHAYSRIVPHLTISIGVASLVPPQEDGEGQLIKAADQMLYEAKREGRNRVACQGEGHVPPFPPAAPTR